MHALQAAGRAGAENAQALIEQQAAQAAGQAQGGYRAAKDSAAGAAAKASQAAGAAGDSAAASAASARDSAFGAAQGAAGSARGAAASTCDTAKAAASRAAEAAGAARDAVAGAAGAAGGPPRAAAAAGARQRSSTVLRRQLPAVASEARPPAAPPSPPGDKASSAAASARGAAEGAAGDVKAQLDSSVEALKGWLSWGGSVSQETQEKTGGAFDELRCAGCAGRRRAGACCGPGRQCWAGRSQQGSRVSAEGSARQLRAWAPALAVRERGPLRLAPPCTCRRQAQAAYDAAAASASDTSDAAQRRAVEAREALATAADDAATWLQVGRCVPWRAADLGRWAAAGGRCR
jgi:hypothetical protein